MNILNNRVGQFIDVTNNVANATTTGGVVGTSPGLNGLLKIRIPYFRRLVGNTGDGIATFYIASEPAYLPGLNDTVLITHTEIPTSSSGGLINKLSNLSTNTVAGLFQGFSTTSNAVLVNQTDTYSNYFTVRYTDSTFSLQLSAGDCRGYIEYYVSPAKYSILKPIEAAVVVNESVPYDNIDGYNNLYGSPAAFTGATTNVMPMFFVERQATNSIFANLLKSLNLPVSDAELGKYSRTNLGYLTQATSTQIPTVYKSNMRFYWNKLLTDTLPSGVLATDLITNPVSGDTGEYYNTVLQTIGANNFVQTAYSKLPVPNDLFLILDIKPNQYGAIIDGKSIQLTLPYWTGATSTSYIKQYLGIKNSYSTTQKTISLYGTYNNSNLNIAGGLDNVLSELDLSLKDLGEPIDLSQPVSNYESNVVLLFSDTIKTPSLNTLGSWSDGHSDVIDGEKVFTPNAQVKNTYNHFNDTCVWVAYLDKGFIVITHPTIVDSVFINAFNGAITTGGTASQPLKVYDMYGNVARSSAINRTGSSNYGIRTYTGSTNFIFNRDNSNYVQWENTEFVYTGKTTGNHKPTTPYMEFLSYNYEKSLNIVCLASSDEFYKSTNDTAKELMSLNDSTDYASFNSTVNQSLMPVVITQLGIHDAQGNLLAVCKPTQPIQKYWYDVVSFNVKIRL